MSEVDVIYEDNHLLVVNKPTKLATMGAAGQPTLHSLGCDYIRRTCNKPGKVYLGIVSRLDSMTSGVIVLARTSKAASRLTPQFANHSGDGARKTYLAAVSGRVEQQQGELVDDVYKDETAHRMRVAHHARADAKEARLEFHLMGYHNDSTLLRVTPLTGRKHQIRLQWSEAGFPILGDQKYGSERVWPNGIALHSWRLSIIHPTTKDRMAFEAPIPEAWKNRLGSSLFT
ncbi:RluA family pseudouridine synthase [Rhodopirellula bahusiensis]|uniref:RNA pseudouridine synthase n=1 Tax=Rhodopirellula bahusiensis TaxID=2014065 RepID=A0A2G1W674_9BACT|nr:RluA family pseudouridine synthase [Rhodopirellula bahusiensis]PHQ34543.1 RNA pseudouridine synthase [Rhodopirellula bahusiensis]